MFDFTLIEGSYDNFQQHWKSHTDEELHKDTSGILFKHIHIKIDGSQNPNNSFDVTIYSGRNNKQFIATQTWRFENDIHDNVILLIDDDKKLKIRILENGFVTEDGQVQYQNDVLTTTGFGVYPVHPDHPYRCIKCRFFSGFIEYALSQDHDEYHRYGDLELHDQGGLVQLDVDSIDYTIELTQLVYAHRIFILKLAIYDLPLDQIDINSKAISYTWTNPEAKRVGINIRKIISGWTLIEEGFLSSNNLNE